MRKAAITNNKHDPIVLIWLNPGLSPKMLTPGNLKSKRDGQWQSVYFLVRMIEGIMTAEYRITQRGTSVILSVIWAGAWREKHQESFLICEN